MENCFRTRIAPTPSGFLHLGNVLSFSLTAALARQSGAKILLRFDDLDSERTGRQYLQDVFDTLQFLGIPWDEGPRDLDEYDRRYSQLHRLDAYTRLLQELRGQGALFACSCSRADLLRKDPQGVYSGACIAKKIPLDTPNVSWRVIATGEKLQVNNWNGGRIRSTLPEEMQYFIVRRKDGLPAYQLASLCDDLHFDVDLIVRGNDLWPSTLAQLYLAKLLGRETFSSALFCHHPLILEKEGRKVSKSAGDISIQSLRKKGCSPAEVYAAAAQALGLSIPVQDWRELAGAVLDSLPST